MSSTTKSWDDYERSADELVTQYESLTFEAVHPALMGCLPDRPGAILDVGAGSGRDANWFAEHGHQVVAIEPSEAMRTRAQALHPHPCIRWSSDSLPDLHEISRSGLTFDLITLSGVWMHVAPADRDRAFRKLTTLLTPGGRIAFSLRHGPPPLNRWFHSVNPDEVDFLATRYGLFQVNATESADALGRPDVTWTTHVYQLPDDGSGALPLLRSIILRDRKSSTYKLALLRVICRIAEDHSGAATEEEGGCVELPMGLVALYWLRAYLPLYRRSIPQHPQPATSFSKCFERLQDIDPQQLRPGMTFHGGSADSLFTSLQEATRTIRVMPATYITNPNDDRPVFRVLPSQASRGFKRGLLVLDQPGLWALGRFAVPADLWRAFRRLAPWIEPLLRQEWATFMGSLSKGAPLQDLWTALAWADPERDTREVRFIAERLIMSGHPIYCIWSGRSLVGERLDIDHCFPMAAWPCQDLWNLVPSSPSINLKKSDRLVSAEKLAAAKDRLLDWWQRAYRPSDTNGELAVRFRLEAQMSLSLVEDSSADPEWIYRGVALKRLALSRAHQVKEWT